MTPNRWFISLLLGLGLSASVSAALQAASPETAPADLKTLITQIEAAANRHDLEQVMSFHSPAFTSTDGLTTQVLSQSLPKLWQRYPNLAYTTQLQAWEQQGEEWIADTATQVKGTSNEGGRVIQLESTLKSRQTFKNGKLIAQTIVDEQTRLTTGQNPPQVEVNLPNTVRVGQEFDFDVIVTEPLGNDLLAGTAIGENTRGDGYLAPGTLELQLLQAGGLFKRVKAPEKPGDRWFSAILVRNEGIVLITKRVRFIE